MKPAPAPPRLHPVFIGGCPRSGTTLLGSMLGAHTRCITPRETLFKGALLKGRAPAHLWASATEALKAAPPSRNLSVWRPYVLQVFDSTPAVETAVLLERVVQLWGAERGSGAADIWIDHTPANITLSSTLHHHWPHARFIHLVRDGRAVAASVMRLDWGPATVLGGARWWLRYIAQGLAAEVALRSGILRIRYEDLVLDTECTIKRCCSFLDLDFEPAVMAADGFDPSTTARRRSHNELIGIPPQANRVRAWERQLSEREIEIFEHLAGEVLANLGYSLRFDGRTRPAGASELVQSGFKEAGMWLREIRQRRRVVKGHS